VRQWLINYSETFIAPSGANRPSLFSTPRDLFKLQLQRLKRKSSDVLMMGIYWFTHRKAGLKLRFRQTAPTAVALHRQMYTAFAEGDVKTLRRICCEGLNDSFAARIHGRGKEKVQWELVKYNKRPRVMSNKAASLPRDGSGVRQAVVRISSRQRLTRYGANGKIIPGSGKEKDVVEYVVIQKILLNGQEGEWQVWGTTGESTLEQIEEENKAALI
jgi:protein MBA1